MSSYHETVYGIIHLNRRIASFWRKAHGWAPTEAADLLSQSRLDWQVSLSHYLYRWASKRTRAERDGALILAWANLGSLTEGTMKFLLCVYLRDYNRNPVEDRKGGAVSPDGLGFEQLRQFFNKQIWGRSEAKRWNAWLGRIQARRNAIHAYRDRDIGSFRELRQSVKEYHGFLTDVHGRVPYPDVFYS